MEQCRRCRYSLHAHDELRCWKRMMQRCQHEGSIRRLEMVSGLCGQLNPNDDCPVFKPRLWDWLKGLLGKFRNVTKD